ncbi:MAG: hypothetical protein HZA10_02275 [Nitrospirae bacterium]|nr:hypothetical protein [Nitrospirota bacterium]
MKKEKRLSIVICLLNVLFLVNIAYAVEYTYTELFPGTDARGLNNFGVVVGSPDGSGTQRTGFIYSNGSYSELLPTGQTYASAYGINNNGEVVGTGSTALGYRGFLYSNGSYTEIRPSGWGEHVVAVDINDSGAIVGYGEHNNEGSMGKGYLYSSGNYTEILPSGWSASRAVAINNNGDVAGDGYGFGASRAFVYSNGSYTEFMIPGLSYLTLIDINNNGDIIGNGYDGQGYKSFLFSNGSYSILHMLGSLEVGPQWPYTDVRGLNNNGDAVGCVYGSNNTIKGFLYSGGTYTEILPTGWSESSAQAINDNGTIVGWGKDSTGTSRGFIASPVVPDNDNDGYPSDVDCDDSNPAVNPGATEIPNNGIDDDCNPSTPIASVSGNAYNYPIPLFRASMSVNVNASSLGTSYLRYYYTRNRLSLVSTSITGISASGGTAIVTGVGTINGASGYTFTATITDGSPVGDSTLRDTMGLEIKKPDGTNYFSASKTISLKSFKKLPVYSC